MLPIAHKWDKIAKELQKLTKLRIACTGKMCKNKWNGLNSDFEKKFRLSHMDSPPHIIMGIDNGRMR
jgi:hypothetical protein